MNYIRILVLCLIGVAMQHSFAQGVFPFKYEKYVLENGFQSIIIPVKGSGLVSYYSVVRTGSRDEWEKGKSGFAHFFEHMMFRGTDRYPGSVYDSIVTTIGADANAYTSDDLTVYHLNLASEHLSTVMDLESDRFQFLNYSEQQFQTEAGAVYGEYRMGRTNPWSVMFEEMQDMAFDKHTYKHTTIGFERDIKNMPNMYEFSKSFYQRYYRPENVVLVLVGDFDPESVKPMIKQFYGGWKPGYTEPKIDQEPVQTAARKKEIVYDGKTLPMVMIGYKTDAFDVQNKNFMATLLLQELAFGETSDLYKKLVLQEQKVEFVSAAPGINRDPYMFMIYARVKNPVDIDYVIQSITETLDHFKSNAVSEKKFEDLKKRNKYSFLMGLDSPDDIASVLPQWITLTGGIEVIDQMYTAMDAMTTTDIMNAARHYFVPERSNTIIMKEKQQ